MANAGVMAAIGYEATVARLRQHDLAPLAPKFRERLEAAMSEAVEEGLDVMVFETMRGDELAKLYYAHGVSNAKTALYTWHHYGLAADIISRSREWDVYPNQMGEGGDSQWYRSVERIFKSHGLDWGGDWKSLKDWPHWQFNGCSPSPHDAPQILATEGLEAVWRAVGAV